MFHLLLRFEEFRRRCSRINCAMGLLKEMLPVLERTDQIFVCSDYCKAKCRTSRNRDGKTYYDVTEDEFAAYMSKSSG